jgi:cytochrome d ubiquinol oxidase subunit II
METIWFCIVAVMLAAYVLLDGFDLGAGVIHLFAGRQNEERRAILGSIGPVWDGNEVWLLAAGGVLYFAFPGLYASAFSGFYLALMVVLWLLMLRGLSIEFRGQMDSPLWRSFWDVTLCASSALLAIFYGAALGNVVRGVPLNRDGYFFTPFWTNFRIGPEPGIIDWFTVLVGVCALLVLSMHGALWVAYKTRGDLETRSAGIASKLYWPVCALVLATTVASFSIQPHIAESLSLHPLLWAFPLVGASGLLGIRLCLRSQLHLASFFCSAMFIVGLLCSAAFGLYPYVLPSSGDTSLGLTVFNVAAPLYGLRIGLLWWTPAFLLAIAYSTFVYRHFRGKTPVEPLPEGHQGTLRMSPDAEKNSGSGRSTVGERAAADDPVECRL